MKTLVELYDHRAIENVIGAEVFRPEKVIYLCPEEVLKGGRTQKIIRSFLRRRGLDIETEFVAVSIYKTDKILKQLRNIGETNRDIAIDISGGTDAALFASGVFSSEADIPVFTYSGKKNKFYSIRNASFADVLPCELRYSVEDFFAMTGGTMRKGRVDNKALAGYLDMIDPFFDIFSRYQRSWNNQIVFMQRISQNRKDEAVSLHVEGSFEQKGEHGGRVFANLHFLEELQRIGMLYDLEYEPGVTVSFRFKDEQVRAWLRDVGSVLELYMYKACIDAGIFSDVISSAVVDWDGTVGHESVSNEIDVVASKDVIPLFISCKACEVRTEAINELSVLAERFGGRGAKAAIATTKYCNGAARHRAAQLGISIIDMEEMQSGRAAERIRMIMEDRDDSEWYENPLYW